MELNIGKKNLDIESGKQLNKHLLTYRTPV